MPWSEHVKGENTYHPVAGGAARLPALLVEGAPVGAGLAPASLHNARGGGEDRGENCELHFEGWWWWFKVEWRWVGLGWVVSWSGCEADEDEDEEWERR